MWRQEDWRGEQDGEAVVVEQDGSPHEERIRRGPQKNGFLLFRGWKQFIVGCWVET
jgi:very-short-patch-repair endonuclease